MNWPTEIQTSVSDFSWLIGPANWISVAANLATETTYLTRLESIFPAELADWIPIHCFGTQLCNWWRNMDACWSEHCKKKRLISRHGNRHRSEWPIRERAQKTDNRRLPAPRKVPRTFLERLLEHILGKDFNRLICFGMIMENILPERNYRFGGASANLSR